MELFQISLLCTTDSACFVVESSKSLQINRLSTWKHRLSPKQHMFSSVNDKPHNIYLYIEGVSDP